MSRRGNRPRAWNSTLPTRTQPMRRSQPKRTRTALPRRNPERAARRFAVQFSSAERVEWWSKDGKFWQQHQYRAWYPENATVEGA